MTLVINKALGEMLERSEIDTLNSKLTAIREIDGNPMGVEIQKFGNATAFLVKNIPGPAFNKVIGLKEGDQIYLEKMLEFYNGRNIPVLFDLTPAYASSDLLAYLNKLGFNQVDFHTTLFKPVQLELNEPLMNPQIYIREIKGNEFDTFADIYTKGFQMPAFLKSGVAQNNEILFNNKHWTFYLAFIDNEPAGIGVMYIKNRVATLAAAATVPTLRNKGIQTALIKQRIYQAYMKKCDLIVGQAKFGSSSQNNMERVGMRIAYTKAIWGKEVW
ncbi:GNAT family N-acetyltransferase [Bacillus sp. FSL K6-3431]|uniref:GNAT family N-acetyltransferase n=1 Tax=Bacillus sp. FSL K6-3431 TaxID=2921500 RepID=UPI0030F7F90A